MNKKQIKLTIIFSLILVFIFIFLSLGKFLIVSDELEKADAIVVFSGDNGPRTEEAVRLLKEGYGDYLLLSGGKVYDYVTMASLMKEHAIKLGIDEDKILVEDKASSTYENAIFSKEIIEDHNFDSIILVTSEYHTRRTKLTMEKVLKDLDVKVMMAYSKEEEFNTNWWTSGESILITISEYLKLLGYWVRGQI